MKLCPECQANVEGLIDHCDCCGASLDIRIRLFSCGIHDMPECLGLSSLVFQMIDEIEPTEPEKYQAYLEKVFMRVICYPDTMLSDGTSYNQVRYSASKRHATVTVLISYNDYVFAGKQEKAAIVAGGLLAGISLLRTRLQKNKLDIDEIAADASRKLNKYRINS